MSILTLEIPDSEKSNFLNIISNLDYIKLIDDENEDVETLALIEKGIKEALDIQKGVSKSYSLDELYFPVKERKEKLTFTKTHILYTFEI